MLRLRSAMGIPSDPIVAPGHSTRNRESPREEACDRAEILIGANAVIYRSGLMGSLVREPTQFNRYPSPQGARELRSRPRACATRASTARARRWPQEPVEPLVGAGLGDRREGVPLAVVE